MDTRDIVLLVGDDPESRPQAEQALVAADMTVVSLGSGEAALAWLEHQTPLVVVLDLTARSLDGHATLRLIRGQPHLTDVPVVVLTTLGSDEDIRRIFAMGADDYVHKPFRPAELVARIRGQTRLRDYVERLNRREKNSQIVLELTQALASSLNIRDILFAVVRQVASVTQVDRCSIVLVGEQQSVGYVVASSDDEQLRDLPIHLGKYPEIREVLATGNPLVIPDAAHHPLLAEIRQNEPFFGFTSLALVPILHEHGPFGVIFLRSKNPMSFSSQEMALVHTVSNATAIALRNARILQSLRDESQQSAFARLEAERRVQLFQRYADFFESAADGMVVIDRNGTVLFANPRAREILGYSETELMGRRFSALIVDEERERVVRLLRGFGSGIYPRCMDLGINPKGGSPIIISVSFSSVLHEDNAVLFSFREVTLERKTAVELQQTKEFLERVIDSSIDAIVSADLSGRILLFNRAASRLFGYDPNQVVGRLNVAALYPPEGARRVMRKIVDPKVSGPRRLEGYRVEVVNAAGEPIHVTVSAALIMESGQPVGSVGIFTDIRDKLRMEERLMRAQRELRAREKESIVAELAGTAAHELNQPLTSVIGYAELLRRSLRDDHNLCSAAGIIISEAERMAEIVRKIGKITRYETKDYVGEAKILDLEKASEEADSGELR
ncbi:MAG: PAS domain S-box protein [Polyangiaceae bacterium]|nr:PAS domain S-box protein [Polyangiaceae bacterium]